MLRKCRWCVSALYWAEDQLMWLFRYPIFPLQIVLMLLASWGVLGADLGVERLFWSEDAAVQLGCGAAVGMLFGVVLFVWYLLDRPVRAVAWAAQPGRPTLFHSSDPAIRAVGAYLFWAMPLLLLLVVAGKVVMACQGQSNGHWHELHQHFSSRHYLVFGILGYAGAVGLGWVLYVIDEKLGLRAMIVRSPLFRRFGGLGSGRVPSTDMSLHAASAYLVLVGSVLLAAALGAVVWLNELRPGAVITSPVLLICLVLILLSLLYGFWSFHIHLGALTLVVVLIGLCVWNSASLFPEVAYKLQIPGLEEYYPTQQRVALDQVQNGWSPGASDRLRRPLLQNEVILEAMLRRWQQHHGVGSKPKIVLIAVSGGGVRSATWTAHVLEGLEQRLPPTDTQAGIRDHIRLITGASGGMVAAALYVADFERDWPDRGQPEPTLLDRQLGLGLYSGIVAEQSLLPTFQTAIMRDFSRNLFVPPWSSVGFDRGRSLEEKWMLNARARGFGPPAQRRSELEQLRSGHRLSPFQRTFAELYELEAVGRRPSLIFAPMLAEDSRRLLISNLDLHALALAAPSCSLGTDHHDPTAYSRSGLECFKLFPTAQESLEIGTAARLNATFPVISPAVSLPTTPPRHVLDAGYFDNYGVDLALMWLVQHRVAVERCCSGVALLEIRAFPLQEGGLDVGRLVPPQPEAMGLMADALAPLSTPMQAVLRARANVAYHRNNELLAVVQRLFSPAAGQTTPFFQRFLFELDAQAALSWYISDEEKRRIGQWFNSEPIQQQVEALAKWFGKGGGP
ncbi:MAG: patatin-like phospholipase family protein [Gemmataceae bacterium]|nr:patatin-like phospholipase family protein [Gemmataceae bacterium]MDW8242354.1 patatin-like phospholipase family protein [Thermogemmata sp.]